MIDATLDRERSLLVVRPGSSLEKADFPELAAHFRVIRDHQRHIRHVALVTDSVVGNVAEKLAAHFVAAEIRHFQVGELAAAIVWASSSS